jgi:adenylosuccinate lyase
MPLPVRYADQVPEMTAIWSPEGYFAAQTGIWLAQCEAAHELTGVPTATDLDQIRAALRLTPEDVAALNVAQGHETNKLLRLVQSRLPAHLGNLIHRGNTSSDVLDTSLSLQILRSLALLDADFRALADALRDLALRHARTPQIARTHGQHAVPHTFGRQVLGWYAEVERARERLARARAVIAVGKFSGEVGTSVFITPEMEEATLRRLGLQPDPAPTQVIGRDRHAEVVALLAVNAATLARIATNISLLAITDLGEVREPFDPETQQGSSAMPHKRNTELCERVRGLARRVWGAAQEELGAAVLWLERDISHSSTERFTFPDAFGCLAYAARLLTEVVAGLVVYPDRMAANVEATAGAIYGSRLLNALLATERIGRTEAYDLTRRLAQEALDSGVHLRDLARRSPEVTALLGTETLDELFRPDFYLRNVAVAYRRLGLPWAADAPPTDAHAAADTGATPTGRL